MNASEQPRSPAQRLATPIEYLKGVGPQRAELLDRLGLRTVGDVLFFLPRGYEDLTDQRTVDQLEEDKLQSVRGTVEEVELRSTGVGRCVLGVLVRGAGGHLRGLWFNQPYMQERFRRGQRVMFSGKPKCHGRVWEMTHPRVETLADDEEEPLGKILPLYPLTEGLQQWQARKIVRAALESCSECLDEIFPEEYRRAHDLWPLDRALGQVHFPDDRQSLAHARRRLVYQELFLLGLALAVKRRRQHDLGRAPPLSATPQIDARIRRLFPFELTAGQRQAIAEIGADMGRPQPMNRLLQGDVGAGKTVVALATLLYGVQGGHQGALMVPTEVLAEQHYLAARSFLAGLEVDDSARIAGARPLEVALLTNRTTGGERARIQAELVDGSLDLVVGTHALLTDNIRFRSLGVVVIDEQHRFGVEQRAALREKGPATIAGDGVREGESPTGTPEAEQGSRHPDVLVMTATPIPRTAAMTVYGDLDQTVLDELPVGRTPVTTAWLNGPDGHAAAWERVRKEIAAGHQAYVICPLVGGGQPEDEESEALQEAREPDYYEPEDYESEPCDGAGRIRAPMLPIAGLGLAAGETPKQPPKSVVEEHARLSSGELAGLAVGLLHGQLASKEKEATMAAFRRGELQVLVATTVIEVGVDVANATVMVIEDADRFGIAQLHQLRGRVGRGTDKSWCYLLAEAVTDGAARRLRALEESSDGFELAEVDLELRGEGTVFGIRQKGRSDLRLASLRRDKSLVRAARRVAEAIVDEDPALEAHPLLADEVHLFVAEESEEFVLKG